MSFMRIIAFWIDLDRIRLEVHCLVTVLIAVNLTMVQARVKPHHAQSLCHPIEGSV